MKPAFLIPFLLLLSFPVSVRAGLDGRREAKSVLKELLKANVEAAKRVRRGERSVAVLPPELIARIAFLTASRGTLSPEEKRELDRLISVGRSFLGTPYSWGGNGPDAFDCSGFVGYCYRQLGINLPRVSRDMVMVGASVRRDGLQEGDLLFFVKSPGGKSINHVAMYIDDGDFIHAAAGEGEVTVNNLSESYYASRFHAARRVIGEVKAGKAAPGEKGGKEKIKKPRKKKMKKAGEGKAGKEKAKVEVPKIKAPKPRQPMEHEGEKPPLTFRTTPLAGPIAQYAPVPLTRLQSAVGVRTGAGAIADEFRFAFNPEVSLFFPDVPLQVGLGLPVLLTQKEDGGGAKLSAGPFDEWRDWFRPIETVILGQKEAPLYMRLGRSGSTTVGYGQLMRNYASNIEGRYLPLYRLSRDDLALNAELDLEKGGGELFVNDALEWEILAVRPYARPFVEWDVPDVARSVTFGMTWATDQNAPAAVAVDKDKSRITRRTAVNGFGFDAGTFLYTGDDVDLASYLDWSILKSPGIFGSGYALGLLMRAQVRGEHLHKFRLRAEGRLHDANFIPSYFDPFYGIQRQAVFADRGFGGELFPKAALPALRMDEKWRGGGYFEAEYAFQNRFWLGLSYETDGRLGDSKQPEVYFGKSFSLQMGFRYLRVPWIEKELDMVALYHLRNFRKAGGVFSFAENPEYLYLTASLKIYRFLFVNGVLRKAIEAFATGPVAARSEASQTDGMIDVSIEYRF